jgi:hypothetical protein
MVSSATMNLNHISSIMAQGATITSGRISATMTYAIWHEDHLWNVCLFQRQSYLYFCVTLGNKNGTEIQLRLRNNTGCLNSIIYA